MLEIDREFYHCAGIYQIKNTENHKVYIGKTRRLGRRLGEHRASLRKGKHRNKELQQDYDLLGEDKFVVNLLYVGEDGLDELEVSCIASARKDDGCYNVFGGRSKGYSVTDEFREKISRAHKGRVDSDETRAKKSNATKKQWKNTSYRDLMIESAKKQWQNEAYRKIMYDAHTTKLACGHKLNEEQVLELRKLRLDGESEASLAERYGVTSSAIRDAVIGRTWKNVPSVSP